MAGSLTWLGHASFRIDTPGGRRVYVDPRLGNPNCPEAEKQPERVDLIALTHEHGDHVGETVELHQRFGCPVVALVELRGWLAREGVEATSASRPGLVIELEDGTTLYSAGDTNVFMDMQLIGRIYEPDVAVLPIGDHFTMGSRKAAVAPELLGSKRLVPCHWGTFPLLHGRPEQLAELAPNVQVERIEPGETVQL